MQPTVLENYTAQGKLTIYGLKSSYVAGHNNLIKTLLFLTLFCFITFMMINLFISHSEAHLNFICRPKVVSVFAHQRVLS